MPDPQPLRDQSGGPMPVFAIKARDALAIPALRAYRQECEDHGLHQQALEVDRAIEEFRWWQETHINETKLPDHKHKSAGLPGSGSERRCPLSQRSV